MLGSRLLGSDPAVFPIADTKRAGRDSHATSPIREPNSEREQKMAAGSKDEIVETEVALCNELDEVERRRQNAGVLDNPPGSALGETLAERAFRLGLTALCLSGGGIRSAAFSLGVLQSLAQKRLLNEFDYLSTVSGGGFIGGWLQMLIKESGDIRRAQEILATNSAPPVRRLRAFTN